MSRLTIRPLQPFQIVSNNYIVPNTLTFTPATYPSITNGSITTNVFTGSLYVATASGPGWAVTKTNYFPIQLTNGGPAYSAATYDVAGFQTYNNVLAGVFYNGTNFYSPTSVLSAGVIAGQNVTIATNGSPPTGYVISSTAASGTASVTAGANVTVTPTIVGNNTNYSIATTSSAGGTVTSVSGDGTVTSGTITTSGSLSLVPATAGTFLGNNTGGSAAPIYLPYSDITNGVSAAMAANGTTSSNTTLSISNSLVSQIASATNTINAATLTGTAPASIIPIDGSTITDTGGVLVSHNSGGASFTLNAGQFAGTTVTSLVAGVTLTNVALNGASNNPSAGNTNGGLFGFVGLGNYLTNLAGYAFADTNFVRQASNTLSGNVQSASNYVNVASNSLVADAVATNTIIVAQINATNTAIILQLKSATNTIAASSLTGTIPAASLQIKTNNLNTVLTNLNAADVTLNGNVNIDGSFLNVENDTRLDSSAITTDGSGDMTINGSLQVNQVDGSYNRITGDAGGVNLISRLEAFDVWGYGAPGADYDLDIAAFCISNYEGYSVIVGSHGSIQYSSVWQPWTNVTGVASPYTADRGDLQIVDNMGAETGNKQITLPEVGVFADTEQNDISWTFVRDGAALGPAYYDRWYAVYNLGSNTANTLSVCTADHISFTNYGGQINGTNVQVPNMTKAVFTTFGTNGVIELSPLGPYCAFGGGLSNSIYAMGTALSWGAGSGGSTYWPANQNQFIQSGGVTNLATNQVFGNLNITGTLTASNSFLLASIQSNSVIQGISTNAPSTNNLPGMTNIVGKAAETNQYGAGASNIVVNATGTATLTNGSQNVTIGIGVISQTNGTSVSAIAPGIGYFSIGLGSTPLNASEISSGTIGATYLPAIPWTDITQPSETANTFLAGPVSGSSAASAFRAINQQDLPTIAVTNNFSASLTLESGLSVFNEPITAPGGLTCAGITVTGVTSNNITMPVAPLPGILQSNYISASNAIVPMVVTNTPASTSTTMCWSNPVPWTLGAGTNGLIVVHFTMYGVSANGSVNYWPTNSGTVAFTNSGTLWGVSATANNPTWPQFAGFNAPSSFAAAANSTGLAISRAPGSATRTMETVVLTAVQSFCP